MYDVIIIGGGPAGVSAGIYASRKKLKTLLLTDTIGGQSAVSASIENWIGDISLKGFEFAQKLEKHLRAQEDIEIQTMTKVESVESIEGGFRVLTKKEEAFETKTIIIATGGKHRHLNVPGEEKFMGKGVVYCSTCDAPFFKNKKVAVVGAGNSGLEACQDLFPYAEKIYLLSNSERLGGDVVLQEEIRAHKKVEIVYSALTKEILGQNVVTGLLYEDILTKKEKTILLDGVFVEIGMVPNSDFLGDLVERNNFREIILDHRTGETSMPGIFGAGDATDVLYKQNNISAGQGALSALSAYDFIKKQSL
jgi:alkyl hydroperoxide reductase subunit F